MAEEQRYKRVTEFTHIEAHEFFLKGSSYCSIELPPYITFDKILSKVNNILRNKDLKTFSVNSPRDYDNVNYTLYDNKDGLYAWRPFQIIHPALYVSLVNEITKESSWNYILGKFKEFQSNEKIQCISIPVKSLSEEKDKAEQITRWWQEIEQKSIEYSLDFDYITQTDITDCYGSIYTHTISWALHTKPVAKLKQNRKNALMIGSIIDEHIQDMNNGQTNSLPQGSVLMDLIAEMVLGYSDLMLSAALKEQKIEDYSILRYRDDYRIFTNNPSLGDRILKTLTEVMIEVGLRINPTKTFTSNHVIKDSIKKDKLHWLFRVNEAKSFQKHLLIIHDHSSNFPNSGRLPAALLNFLKRIQPVTTFYDTVIPMISIATDIAYHNPRTYQVITAIISKLINHFENDRKVAIIDRVQRKFSKLPNTGLMNIWLQRISLDLKNEILFNEKLCNIVAGGSIDLWNSQWINQSSSLTKSLESQYVIDKKALQAIKPVIRVDEIKLYVGY